jgi:hypothetical protein
VEPFVDGGDVDGGFVADGEFVVPGGQGPVALEAADAAFDGVPLFVDLGVEGWRPTALAALVLAVATRSPVSGVFFVDEPHRRPRHISATNTPTSNRP